MPVFSWSHSSKSTAPPTQTPLIPTIQRRKRIKTRRVRPHSTYSTAPGIGARDSSLYLPPAGSESPFNPPPALPFRHSFLSESTSTHDIPEYGFFDTQAHREIWEELFASANHTTRGRVERYQQERERLTSASVLGLTMPGSDELLHGEGMERAMRSEIWIKVGLNFSFLITFNPRHWMAGVAVSLAGWPFPITSLSYP